MAAIFLTAALLLVGYMCCGHWRQYQLRPWACWNFRRESIGGAVQSAYVTDAMNLLQGLITNKQYLVTLNRPNVYSEKHVVAQMDYHHPFYTNVKRS